MTFLNIGDTAHLERLLAKLQIEQQPVFGQMTPQHMVEHLSFLLVVSRGKKPLPQVTPEDKLLGYLAFLQSEKPLPENFKAPFIEGLPKLYYPDLDTAKNKLFIELNNFYDYYTEYPVAKNMHPVFGPLDKNQWELFHNKHFTHHFRQFALI